MNSNNLRNNMSNSHSSSISISPSPMAATSSTRSDTNCSPINTSIATDKRRSVRLLAKSPKKTSASSSQSSLHRTISGGVGNAHSPKLNVRKRTSGSTDTHGTSTSSITYSTITSNDNINRIHYSNHNNKNTYSRHILPSDQSDDDEMLINNSTIMKPKPTALVSRSEVLSYFSIQDNGYKCKLCDNVNLLF